MTSVRKKIIIVDDFDFFLESFKKQLEDKYDIYTAQNFEDFYSLLIKVEPDLIILDIEMPGFNGFDLLRMVRDVNHYDYIPIIYLSQLDDEETVTRAMSLGADDFLHKSFTKDKIIMRIEKQLDLYNKKRDEPIILAVDEDISVLRVICNTFRNLCKVYGLPKTISIHDFLSIITPDLYILDYTLLQTPDSYILSAILDHALKAESSVIFLLAGETTSNISNEYVTINKPIDARILKESVFKCLDGYKTRRALQSIALNEKK